MHNLSGNDLAHFRYHAYSFAIARDDLVNAVSMGAAVPILFEERALLSLRLTSC